MPPNRQIANSGLLAAFFQETTASRTTLSTEIPYHRIAEVFWRGCEIDAARLTQWVVNCGRPRPSARLAHLLCELAVRSEMAGLGSVDDFALSMTQTQIGETLGLTAVHVNRVLQRLRRDDLIQYRQGTLHVPTGTGLPPRQSSAWVDLVEPLARHPIVLIYVRRSNFQGSLSRTGD